MKSSRMNSKRQESILTLGDGSNLKLNHLNTDKSHVVVTKSKTPKHEKTKKKGTDKSTIRAADVCIEQIERELIQLRNITCNRRCTSNIQLLNEKSINKYDRKLFCNQATQTGGQNDKKIADMKVALCEMSEKMEELELMYKVDNEKARRYEEECRISKQKLVEMQEKTERYKVNYIKI